MSEVSKDASEHEEVSPEDELYEKIDTLEKAYHLLEENKIKLKDHIKTEIEESIKNLKGVADKIKEKDEEQKRQVPLTGSELRNKLMRTEFELHRKIDEVKSLSEKNKQLQDHIHVNKHNASSMLKFFEEKGKTADKKIHDLSQELVKSQEIAKKFQLSCVQFQAQINSEEQGHNASTAEKIQIQALLNDNENLRREIVSLRSENTTLMKRVKKAEEEKNIALKAANTSEASKTELQKKINKMKQEHKAMQKSLEYSASEWVIKRRELQHMKEEMKWKLINPDLHGMSPTTSSSSLPRSIYTPKRHMPRPYSHGVQKI